MSATKLTTKLDLRQFRHGYFASRSKEFGRNYYFFFY